MLRRDKPAARKGDFRAVVLCNRRIGARNYRLRLRFSSEANQAFSGFQPGQFVEIDLSQTALPPAHTIPADLADKAVRQILLRRPFSFSNLEVSDGGLDAELLYCVVGPATVRMTALREGDSLQALGPLGHGFTVPAGLRSALLVAGGMGAPPIQCLARILVQDHVKVKKVAFVGARTREDLPFEIQGQASVREFTDLGIEHQVATDDGSIGHKGLVTQCLEQWLKGHPKQGRKTMLVYACGPEPMLAAVAQIALQAGIDCQVSMERRMACGFGVCQGCTVECRSGEGAETAYRLCCQDGPVFNASEVVFEASP